MEGLNRPNTAKEIKETNGNLENNNLNNDHSSNEQSGAVENQEENEENSESDEELLERIRALENKVTQQNQQIVSLAIALKMGKNETDGFLIKSALPTLRNLQTVSYLTKSLVEPLSLTEIYSTRPADFIWTIKDIKRKVKNEEFELVSEEFQLSEYPNKAKAKIQLNSDGWLYTSILIIDDGSESSFANLKVLPAVVYVLKDHYGGKKYDVIQPTGYAFGSNKLDYTKFNFCRVAFYKSALIDILSEYNRNNAITVEFHVEPPAIARHVYSYNGTLNWAICKYKHKKELVQYPHTGHTDQVFECSPYIYIGGYRVQVIMLMYGHDDFQGLGITAGVYFLTGENDERLPKWFLHRTTITLLDRKHDGGNIVKSVDKNIDKDRTYYINLATYKEIEKLISKDILYYQVRFDQSP